MVNIRPEPLATFQYGGAQIYQQQHVVGNVFFFNHLILGLWQSILLMGETFSKDLGPLGLGGTQHISASPHPTMMVFGKKRTC